MYIVVAPASKEIEYPISSTRLAATAPLPSPLSAGLHTKVSLQIASKRSLPATSFKQTNQYKQKEKKPWIHLAHSIFNRELVAERVGS
jgi:hypothetical protein